MKDILDDDQEIAPDKYEIDRLVLLYSFLTCGLFLIVFFLMKYIPDIPIYWNDRSLNPEGFILIAIIFPIAYQIAKKSNKIDASRHDLRIAISGGATIYIALILYNLILNFLILKTGELDLMTIFVIAAIVSILGFLFSFFAIRRLRKKNLFLPILLIIGYFFLFINLIKYFE